MKQESDGSNLLLLKSTYTFKSLLGDFLGVKNGKIIFLVRHVYYLSLHNDSEDCYANCVR